MISFKILMWIYAWMTQICNYGEGHCSSLKDCIAKKLEQIIIYQKVELLFRLGSSISQNRQ